MNFVAPMTRYASSKTPGAAIEEFKTLVRELHKHGIEVILDVVLNHTAEGNQFGPVLSFKALDEQVWYILDENGNYQNYTAYNFFISSFEAWRFKLKHCFPNNQ